jgi:hypothetical protein
MIEMSNMKSTTQNLFPGNSQRLNSSIPQATDLFMSGLHWLKVLAEKDQEIRFSRWTKLIRDVRGMPENLNLKYLEWLWNAITSEPNITTYLGSRMLSRDDEWRRQKSVECVAANSLFGIFFKSFRSYGHPVLSRPKDLKPVAEAEILGPLYMKPGKGRRFECCDVPIRLKIRPDKLGPANVEAAALKLGVADLKIEGGSIHVNVKSLNHADTKASLRLEPNRRSHGGRVYDHVAYKTDEG